MSGRSLFAAGSGGMIRQIIARSRTLFRSALRMIPVDVPHWATGSVLDMVYGMRRPGDISLR
jgi:hypothetical protein